MRGDIMRYRNISASARRLIPLAGLLLATTLGGCVGYTGYPPAHYSYNYGYPGYYSGYPTNYGYSNNYEPGYLPYYSTSRFNPSNPYPSGSGG
jgi:hypothetical protein